MTYQRRTVGIVAAIVLALLGTMGLVGYVQGAKDDAVAGEKLVKVYVAADKIPAGTSATRHRRLVTTEKVPAKVKAEDAVTNLTSLKGEVTTIDLLPGEQLVTSRFVSASAAGVNAKGVPAGMFGATVSLDPEQALGGQVRAGDHVAIVGVVEQQRRDRRHRLDAREQRARDERADRRQQRRQPEEEGSHHGADRQVLRDLRPDPGRPREGRRLGQGRRHLAGGRPDCGQRQ